MTLYKRGTINNYPSNSMKKQKTSSFKHSLLIVAAIISSYLYNIVVWADKWTFSKPVEIARQQAGVFHHVDSSGRQNISAGDNGVFMVWEDNRDGDSDIWLSYYTGHGWSDDIAVPGASGRGIQTHPSLAMDSSSELHLVWVHRDQEGGPTRVRYLRGTLSR